ncbi:MAG TPA: hypothetical protein VII09_08385, partial [Opitutaceae bacterium]
MAVAGAFLATAACAFLYRHDTGQIEQRWRERETIRVKMFSEHFGSDFQTAARDVLVLSSGDALQAYLKDGDPAKLDRAAARAQFFSRGKADYDQVRFLDNQGDEVLRVNRNGQRVAHDQLQKKATRDYFLRTAGLGPGEIYISAVDLNVEGGRVEQPLKPTVRFACPV